MTERCHARRAAETARERGARHAGEARERRHRPSPRRIAPHRRERTGDREVVDRHAERMARSRGFVQPVRRSDMRLRVPDMATRAPAHDAPRMPDENEHESAFLEPVVETLFASRTVLVFGEVNTALARSVS